MDNATENGRAVAANLESVLKEYKTRYENKHVTEYILLTDGAGCYSGTFLFLDVILAFVLIGMRCIGHLITEAGTGKTILDTHFAYLMKVLLGFVVRGDGSSHDLRNAGDIAWAIMSGRGIANTICVEYIFDRSTFNAPTKKYKECVNISKFHLRYPTYDAEGDLSSISLQPMRGRGPILTISRKQCDDYWVQYRKFHKEPSTTLLSGLGSFVGSLNAVTVQTRGFVSTRRPYIATVPAAHDDDEEDDEDERRSVGAVDRRGTAAMEMEEDAAAGEGSGIERVAAPHLLQLPATVPWAATDGPKSHASVTPETNKSDLKIGALDKGRVALDREKKSAAKANVLQTQKDDLSRKQSEFKMDTYGPDGDTGVGQWHVYPCTLGCNRWFTKQAHADKHSCYYGMSTANVRRAGRESKSTPPSPSRHDLMAQLCLGCFDAPPPSPLDNEDVDGDNNAPSATAISEADKYLMPTPFLGYTLLNGKTKLILSADAVIVAVEEGVDDDNNNDNDSDHSDDDEEDAGAVSQQQLKVVSQQLKVLHRTPRLAALHRRRLKPVKKNRSQLEFVFALFLMGEEDKRCKFLPLQANSLMKIVGTQRGEEYLLPLLTTGGGAVPEVLRSTRSGFKRFPLVDVLAVSKIKALFSKKLKAFRAQLDRAREKEALNRSVFTLLQIQFIALVKMNQISGDSAVALMCLLGSGVAFKAEAIRLCAVDNKVFKLKSGSGDTKINLPPDFYHMGPASSSDLYDKDAIERKVKMTYKDIVSRLAKI